MTIENMKYRLRKIEAAHLRLIVRPLPVKAERDAVVAAALARPDGRTLALAALEAEPNPVIRDRQRAVVEAAWRADT